MATSHILPKPKRALRIAFFSVCVWIMITLYFNLDVPYRFIHGRHLKLYNHQSQKALTVNTDFMNASSQSKLQRKPVVIWLNRHKNYVYLENALKDLPCFHQCVLKVEKVEQEDDYTWNNSILWDAFIVQGNRIPKMVPPRRTSAKQVIIFYDTEPPLYIHKQRYKSKTWNGIFNWTMTYRKDSDIPVPYGSIIKQDNSLPKRDYKSIFSKKNKMAVWIASHCKTTSLREKYIELLKRSVDIDIYGRCGNTTYCPKIKMNECEDEIERDYLFYLAFENNICKDYITEKVYKWFNRDLILVTRGGVNYSEFLPQGTYIDAGNFNSIKALGEYLNNLKKNETRYIEYLEKKDRYISQKSDTIKRKHHHLFYCKLCQKLQNVDKFRRSYPDMVQWWLENASCLKKAEVSRNIDRANTY